MCVDNIEMYLREIGRGGIGWFDVVQGRDQWGALVMTVMDFLVT
jgi:hypothetical protein